MNTNSIFSIKLLTATTAVFFGFVSLFAQYSSADKYYQDRITSSIIIGKELLESKEVEEGLNYLKEAIRIAEEHSHDYFLTSILVNQEAFDPIINYYYSIDSTSIARQYIDLSAALFMRYPDAMNKKKALTEDEYAEYLLDCYGSFHRLARDNRDIQYAIKYNTQYIETAKLYNIKTEEYYPFVENLMWEYIYDGKYLEALTHSIAVFDEKKIAGMTDEDAISMAHNAFLWVGMESRNNPSLMQTATKACDIWIQFLKRLYDDNGANYMDSLLLKLDGSDSLHFEIFADMVSTTLAAAMMNKCMYSLALYGYDASKKSLFDFRNELYKTGNSELWPVACIRFICNLEGENLHSATYRFCSSVERDFSSQVMISKKDLLDFYIRYFGACGKVGDFGKALEICANQFERVEESDDYYWFVSQLTGSLFLVLGAYDEGLSYMLRALNHYRWPAQPEETDAIMYTALNTSVGKAYRLMGRMDDAVTYFLKSISICEQFAIPNNKLFPLHELGVLYFERGDMDNARNCFISCVEILSNTDAQFGNSAPLSYLFDIERISGNVDKAREYLKDSWQTQFNEYLHFKDYLTSQEQTMYWTWNVDLGKIGGLIVESSPLYNDIFYDILLASKGFLLRSEIAEYKNVLRSGDEILKQLYFKTHSGAAKQDDIDNYLTRYRSQIFNDELEIHSWKDVQTKLSIGELAIEFFQYEPANIEDGKQYGALLLKNGWKYPKVVHLCSSDDLERLVKVKHRAYSSKGLYDLIWRPISNDLQGIKRIYYSPQGLLHLINLSAISDNNGKPMFQIFQMQRVSSTANIKDVEESIAYKSYVYGGLIYDMDDESMLSEHRKFSRYNKSFTEYSWTPDSSSTRYGWAYLPNTITETEQISGLLKSSNFEVIRYAGKEGTEESFKAIDGTHPGLIHLATHGYFLNYSYADSTAILGNHEKRIASSRNPLVRSGLILSNGGRAWKGESIPSGIEDGILQADEIANINLSGTSLIVLSACETALGDISSDGVYGLQRAFKMAGVSTIVMSLWEVDDKATSLFMSNFYKSWLSGRSKHEAFVDAQNTLMKQYTDPYYWAAFIMLD